ncbi:MAG: hypothetical protein KatS3mg055_2583 [Chloroflexus sp.]|nr:MAG: hypothetical protein KatS3mg055_2583 [Chloroflexus sp.]
MARRCVSLFIIIHEKCGHAVPRRVALKAYGNGSAVPLRVGGTVCRAPTGGVVGVWARQRRAPTAWGDGIVVRRRVVLWGFGHGMPCPYVRSSPLRLCALCAFALTSFALNGVPCADGWCCGGLGTAGPCPYGWGDGVPWADGWCCGGLGTAAPCGILCLGDGIVGARHAVPLRVGPSAPLRPLRLCVNVLCVNVLCVNVLCVKRCTVGRRVVF